MKENHVPVTSRERLEILDLLRGFALLGIFMVNMPLMNAPFITEMGAYVLWTDPASHVASWIIRFFFTGKFYTLFSMLFGIGFYFFLKKADLNGSSTIPLFRRRMGWLLAFGVLHVILLWYGDILVFYALFGFLLILFRKKSNKTLIIWAAFILLIPVVLSSLLVVLMKLALTMPDVAAGIEQSFIEADGRFNELIGRAITVYSTGSFAQIVAMRLEEYRNILGGIFFFYPNVLAMFLVGIVFARLKVFEDLKANGFFFRKLLLYSLPFAIAGNLVYSIFHAHSSYAKMDWDMVITLFSFGFGGPAMTFVYISLIVLAYHRGYLNPIKRFIAKTGRMALTNYLMQSIIATTIFFSYGLGLYGQVNTWQGMILVIVIYVLQVIWSEYWLRYYRFGPMEWIWRVLTYQKRQKMKVSEDII
jgi:uncharacterized protein